MCLCVILAQKTYQNDISILAYKDGNYTHAHTTPGDVLEGVDARRIGFLAPATSQLNNGTLKNKSWKKVDNHPRDQPSPASRGNLIHRVFFFGFFLAH